MTPEKSFAINNASYDATPTGANSFLELDAQPVEGGTRTGKACGKIVFFKRIGLGERVEVGGDDLFCARCARCRDERA